MKQSVIHTKEEESTRKGSEWEARHMFKKTKSKLKARQAGRSEHEGALPRMILERQGVGHGTVQSQKQDWEE